MPASTPLFVHSMFRTGSTFVAVRLAENPANLVFYEPFHPGITSRRFVEGRAALHRRFNTEDMRQSLRHEPLPGGTWAPYQLRCAATGRPLRALATARAGTFDVYNGLGDRARAFLAACTRRAHADERRPAFGFCRSGTTVATMRAAFGGVHVHLSRDPRQQFFSYTNSRSRYFLAATIIQLLSSRTFGGPVARWIGLPGASATLLRALTTSPAPAPLISRLGRKLLARTDLTTRYRLFYLAWLLSDAHGRAHSELSVSLQDAHQHQRLRRALEDALAVRLNDLRPIDRDDLELPVDPRPLEQEVEAFVGRIPADHAGSPARKGAVWSLSPTAPS